MSRDLLSLPPSPPDSRVAYGKDPAQFLDIWNPRTSRAVVLMIHGGFWRAKYDLQHTSHWCARIAQSGLTVVNVEYRRVGNGGGWPNTYNDIRSAFDFATTLLPGAGKYLVVGHSAGGHLALRLAVDVPRLSGVLALAAVSVLEMAYELHLSRDAVVEFLGGQPEQIPNLYKAACPSLHPSAVRRVLIHGTADADVPIAISEEFLQARSGDPGAVSLKALPGIGHFELIDPDSEAWPTINSALESLIT